MRVIKAADTKIAKLWDDGKIQFSEYRFLTYIVVLTVDDGMLLHNVVTGEIVLLNREEMERISSLPCSYASWMDELIKKHFLVKTESDDKKTVDSLRIALRITETPRGITKYTILPTTNCNARCFYCYEAGCKHENMSSETADQLVDFMEEHRKGNSISIRWFGGEPLVGIQQIDRISKALKERNIPFHSNMTSNGYLFNKEIVQRAKLQWNLQKVQITLDGTREIYNKTKAYVNPCENPYRRVLDNIEVLAQNDIHVDIRLNMGLHNTEDVFVLVDDLAFRFAGNRNISVYSLILDDGKGFEPLIYNTDQYELLKKKHIALGKKIYRSFSCVYTEELPKLKANCCEADYGGALVVLPSGAFIKCPDLLEKHRVGDVEKGITDKEELSSLKETEVFPKCGSCPFYPCCIRLKMCETAHVCDDDRVQLRIMYAQYIMGHLYRNAGNSGVN